MTDTDKLALLTDEERLWYSSVSTPPENHTVIALLERLADARAEIASLQELFRRYSLGAGETFDEQQERIEELERTRDSL